MSLGQFYTRPDLAGVYVAEVLDRWRDPGVVFVEPSAGTGAFLHPIMDAGRPVCAFDIDPKAPGIRKADFLTAQDVDWNLTCLADDHSAVVVVGNPPFGKNACMAVRFFNKAAFHADEIAFIVPRTFRKRSVQKRLHAKFHLSFDSDVEPDAFVRFGQPHDVPCAWQVWTRRDADRIIPQPPSVDHLIDYTTPRAADFAMRRVGFYAGRVVTENIMSLSETTHYFMRELTHGAIDTLRRVNWTDLAAQTAGVRSLSKTEIAFKLGEVHRA